MWLVTLLEGQNSDDGLGGINVPWSECQRLRNSTAGVVKGLAQQALGANTRRTRNTAFSGEGIMAPSFLLARALVEAGDAGF